MDEIKTEQMEWIETRVTDLVIRLTILGFFVYWSLALIRRFLPIMVWAVVLAVALAPVIFTAIALLVVLGPVAALAKRDLSDG